MCGVNGNARFLTDDGTSEIKAFEG